MPQKTRNPNQVLTVLAVVLLLLGLGAAYFYFLPQLKTAREAMAQAKAKNDGYATDIAALETAQSQLESAQDALKAKGVDLTKLGRVYPATEDVPSLYIQMEHLMGSAVGISGASYQISAPAADPVSGARIPVTVTGTGTYADLKTFIQSLENNIRPISIVNVSFAQALEKDKNGNPIPDSLDKLTLNVSGYFRSLSISSAYAAATPKSK